MGFSLGVTATRHTMPIYSFTTEYLPVLKSTESLETELKSKLTNELVSSLLTVWFWFVIKQVSLGNDL